MKGAGCTCHGVNKRIEVVNISGMGVALVAGCEHKAIFVSWTQSHRQTGVVGRGHADQQQSDQNRAVQAEEHWVFSQFDEDVEPVFPIACTLQKVENLFKRIQSEAVRQSRIAKSITNRKREVETGTATVNNTPRKQQAVMPKVSRVILTQNTSRLTKSEISLLSKTPSPFISSTTLGSTSG